MSTICFDIKRVDNDYVCIQHCDLNKFEYNYHLGLSFYHNDTESWWLENRKYRFVWIVVGKDERQDNIERILWACNNKEHLKKTVEEWEIENSYIIQQYRDLKIVKLPFDKKVKVKLNHPDYKGQKITRYEINDMKDKFKLYCPLAANEKYHIYTDHYEEIEPEVEIIDGYEFKTKRFKWIPPKYLGE